MKNRISKFLCIWLLILGVQFSTMPVSADEFAFEQAELVPATIHSVHSGGFWSAGDDEGYFRAVIVAGGVEHVAHKLFIQWLRIDPETQGYELARTVSVEELNLGPGYVFNVTTDFGDFNAFKIKVVAASRGGKTQIFDITAGANRKYTITKQ